MSCADTQPNQFPGFFGTEFYSTAFDVLTAVFMNVAIYSDIEPAAT
jgi:hypothetical protein